MPDPIHSAGRKPSHHQKPPPGWRVPHGQRVYAIGDIHGRADLLDELHEHIILDAENASSSTVIISVYLGDYVDRGPHSMGVIERLIGNPLPGFQKVNLKGNHEDMLLRFLDDPVQGLGWIANGGAETMASYGLTLKGGNTASDSLASIRDEFAARLPLEHLNFFQSLSVSYVSGDYILVHAGIRPGVPLENQSENDLLWIRDAFLYSRSNHGKVVVHGHTPNTEPELHSNRIGIDTGAYTSGVLTCLVLEGDERRFIATSGDGYSVA